MVSFGIIGMISCRGTGPASRGGMGTASWGVLVMVSCRALGMITALVFVVVGRFAFETFDPIRGMSESWTER